MSTALVIEGIRTLDSSRHLRAVPDKAARVEPPTSASAEATDVDALLLAAGRGSIEAYESVYAALLPQVYRLALRVVRDPDLAEDVAQEALVEAWRLAPTFSTDRGSARAWVLTLAHRRAVDRVRREQRQRDHLEREAALNVEPHAAPAQDDVVEQAQQEWQSARVRAAVRHLSDKQREAIELAYYGGHTQAEVSARLGIPLGTVKTRMRDAMIKLRDTLKEVE